MGTLLDSLQFSARDDVSLSRDSLCCCIREYMRRCYSVEGERCRDSSTQQSSSRVSVLPRMSPSLKNVEC